MLLLCFTLGDARYALPAKNVTAVLPNVPCRSVPAAPAWLRGYMTYHRQAVPVVDLCYLASEQPAPASLGTRMILMDLCYQQQMKTTGFLVTQLIETCRSRALSFEKQAVHVPDSPWLGDVAYQDGHLLQLIEPQAFLTPPVAQLLFAEEGSDG